MTTEKTVSVEDFDNLKTQFEDVSKKLTEQMTAYSDLSEKHAKLEKIFEERQTKTQEQILKALGLEKKPEKTDKEVITEKFAELTTTVKQLQSDLSERDKIIKLNEKKAKVQEIAKPYNFVDVNDVLSVIDYENEDFEGQVKSIAETKKHWIAKETDPGHGFGGKQDDKGKDDAFLKAFESA